MESYLERRANEEIVRAQNAVHPGAVKAHYHLASGYLNRLYPETADVLVDGAATRSDDRGAAGGWTELLRLAFRTRPSAR